MKLLVVTQYFWPESFRINDLVLGLKDQGHEVQILTGMPNYPEGKIFPGYTMFTPGREVYEGIPVIRVPLVRRGSGRSWRLVLNYLSFVLSACILGPLKCRGAFDCIFVFEPSPVTVGIPALLLKKIWKIPVVFWVQDLWPESLAATGAVHSKFILKLIEYLVRFIYHGCDLILVQSRAFMPALVRLGVATGKIYYYPNSAEELYRPMALEAQAPERSLLPTGFCVMFAGNIGAAQDFQTVLAAAALLQAHAEIHWVIVGDGRRFHWLQDQIRERGLARHVHLLGRHPVERMPRFFALADVLLVILRDEPIFALTIPSKIQSYLACGRPIIAALAGEGAEIVEEAGAGLVVAPETPDKLAEAVLTLYRLPAIQRQEMGSRGQAYFLNNFERTYLVQKLHHWLEDIVARKRPSGQGKKTGKA